MDKQPQDVQLAMRCTVDLSSMTAWTSYAKERQDKLWHCANEIREAQLKQGFATLQEAQALNEARKELKKEGEWMNFLEQIYPQSWRTGYDRLELHKRAREKLSERQIAYLAAYGATLMPYRNVPMGEFLNAAKSLPSPKSEKPEDMNPFIEKVGIKFKELKSKRRKEGQNLSKDEAAKEGFNTLLHLLTNAKIRTPQQKREFLEWVVGMVMADQEIPGKASVTRKEVPEGFKVRRGRPPKDKSKNAKTEQAA